MPIQPGRNASRPYAVSFVHVYRGIIYATRADEALNKALRDGESAADEIAEASLHVSLENSIPQGTFTPDLHVPPLSLRDVSERLNIPYSTLRNYQSKPGGTPFPKADGKIGTTSFWWPETIDAWDATRRKNFRTTAKDDQAPPSHRKSTES